MSFFKTVINWHSIRNFVATWLISTMPCTELNGDGADMILRWSDQALFDLDWMYEGVFAACRDFDTTDRYYDGMIASVEAKQDFQESAAKLYIGNIWTGDYYVVYKEYVAFYRIADDVMEVRRIELRKADHVKKFIRG